MSLRTALARWLAPDLAREADRAQYLLHGAYEMKHWLGHDFPMIEVALDRLTIDSRNYFRALNEPPISQEYPHLGGVWPVDMHGFREKLKRTFRAPATGSVTAAAHSRSTEPHTP
jgi:hypothetical protein